MKQRAFSGSIVLLAMVLGVPCAAKAQTSLQRSLGRLPLYFVANGGVYPESVRYSIQGADKTLFFTDGGVTIAFRGQGRGWTVKLDFVGARNDVRPEGRDRQGAVFSYFTGPEKDWKAGLRTFSRVVYRDLWPGIDLVYSGNVNELKYEFVVAPGADPSKIRLRYRGAASVKATDSGALRVETPEGSFEDAPPVAWQAIDGKRVPVTMAYELGASTDEAVEFGFRIGDYDRTRTLVLDPVVIVYCGYIGGDSDDHAMGMAVDRQGCVYVTGNTSSTPTSFPLKVGPSKTRGRLFDVFVAKVDGRGSGLLYCGYLAGSSQDFAGGIAVDAEGNAYLLGRTQSRDFPVTAAWPYPKFVGGYTDAYVAKVNPSGTGLVYSGYIGGSSFDMCTDGAVDASGNLHVTGETASTDLPVRGGPYLQHAPGYSDAWVAKVNAQGTALDYCGYLGGDKDEQGGGIVVDAAGNAFVSGFTMSSASSFPAMNAPYKTYSGNGDVFVARVSSAGVLLNRGYLGGAGIDEAGSVALGPNGHFYLAGRTDSTETNGFPLKMGPDLTYNGGVFDGFVAKMDPQTLAIVYCGYIGGAEEETAKVAVDRDDCAHLAAFTTSDEKTEGFLVKLGPDLTYNGERDAWVAKLKARPDAMNPLDNLVYCGYLGGAQRDTVSGIAVDAAGMVYLAGNTSNAEKDFPVTGGPDPTYNGGLFDVYVAKIALADALTASGSPRPGGTIALHLQAEEARGLRYQVGSSLGAGPTPVDTRVIGVSADMLLLVSVSGFLPQVFQGYAGTLDSQGKASAAIHIPDDSKLIGTDLHTAYVTIDPAWPSGIRSVSETLTFRIAR